ncbi:RHS repeat domain-containing protein [Montanilutibacter psychrotolerans]|uniref:RHS repeat-associated core domain-containing protein n=1 Tax=Montanilutibacter psychrotolerans TaxID=1327343 RepID=A0A3M8ST41_9GAMM|nr:RHS repeat-associated core domain-containing protein [Lysobacter psychrotolerans]RNF82030.1 RHS repeat-associated core domain-containing protein [Lysobacter psychrotolerans]
MPSSSTPSIRTFQMDASTVGVLASSVNLFRGDVNHTQTLFSMPGRSENDGLQVDLSIQYQSNINRQAMTWNRDQPTGVLGMGWQLPMNSIRLDDGGSPTPGMRSYTITISGNASAMVREPDSPWLFSMDRALATQLANGQAVPADVRAQFVRRGLPLSADALIEGDASPWIVRDDKLEQEFTLTLDSQALQASDGGQAYQLSNYRFWKVLYYPRYERWTVCNESGQRMSFGGGVATTTEGYRSSAGNSIEWGVQWVDAHGVPAWQGSSALAAGQQQYARAWHLERAYSRFGESVGYAYNCFERGPDGLLPGVEQLVATGGKPYTKACYLGRITDVFGRTARLGYAAKLWSNATAGSPREYADPHKAVPSTTPNGFQDCYETLFLDAIQVCAADGSLLFSVGLGYDPSPGSPGSEAVANVAGDSGDTCKRLLTSVTLYNAEGANLPGYRFDYALDVAAGGNLGALASITWPTGGVASYDYASVSLPICDRSLAISAPSPMPTQSMARVFFGPDYAVVLWNETTNGKLSMQVFTWNGQWVAWQADPKYPLLIDGGGGTGLATVSVEAGQDFVAVSYRTTQNVNLHLFRKDMARPGQWVAAAIPGGGTGGCNSPTWQWSVNDGAVQIVAGAGFVFASQMSTSTASGSSDRFTWHWPDQAWVHDQVDDLGYRWYAAGRDYVASIDLDSNARLDWIDALGVWHEATSVNLGFTLNNLSSIALSGDLSMVAVSHFIAGSASSGQYDYDVWLLQWNSEYAFGTPTKFSFTDRFDPAFPTSWRPATVANALVAVAGNVIRFDGAQWSTDSRLKPQGVISGEQRYGYGPDYAVQVLVPNGAPTAALVGYDPSGNGWGDPAAITGLTTPLADPGTANWIGAGSPDYLTVGTQLFFRGVATDWGDAVAANIGDLQQLVNQAAGGGSRYQLNSASVINEGPAFIACALYDSDASSTGHATAASALVLRNGGVFGAAQLLAQEQMWTAQEQDVPGQGTQPGGPSAFFTYPDSAGNLDAATTITLHRYAGDAVQGPISDWPVSAITIDDGLSEAFTTTYVADTTNAACDASGEVVKYFQTAVYPGGTVDHPVNGSVISTYLNGNALVTGADWYNMLDGLLQSVATLDAQSNLLASTSYQWTAYVKRAADPVDGSVAARQLYGAYVLQTGQSNMRDGVASATTTSFVPAGLPAPYTGQPASVTSSTVNGAGVTESDVLTYRYACEVNATSRLLNDVSSAVQQSATQAGVATAVSAMALADWPTAWGSDVLTPAEAADFGWTGGDSSFPFADWQPGKVPDGWQAITVLQQRAPDGSVLQNLDGAGTACSTVFASTVGLPVVSFRAAALAECAWNGFQAYEDVSGWQLSGTSPCADNAWLGEQSLTVGVGGSIATTVHPAAGRGTYLLALRYQTPAGYSGGTGAIHLDVGGQPQTFDLADSDGQWRYDTATIALPDGTTTIALTIGNPGSSAVLIDGVLLVPFGTDVNVQSWQAANRLLRASMGASGSSDFTPYDRFNRPLGAVGATGQWQELALRFQSRQGAANDRFDDASPNAELTLQMSGGGITETFRDGGKWRNRWKSGDATAWRAVDGGLVKDGRDADSLTWQGGIAATTGAFFIEFELLAAAQGALSLTFGGGQSIAWNAADGWRWTLADGTSGQAPLAAPPRIAQQWLLVVGGGHLLFFADGQLLFSADNAATVADGCVFDTGTNTLRVSQLGVGADPRLGLSYTDGAARQRQIHQRHGEDSRVMEAVYDALDRQLASTKVAPGSFGSGADVPMLRYRNTFLDVPAFLAATASSWSMQGDIADYYAGQSDGAVVRSDDQDYPYNGTRYEASAQQRAIEAGKPGLALSIHDINQPASGRQTTRMAYTASDASDPVAAGRFYATTTTTPGGYDGRQLVDTSNRAAAMLQSDTSGNNVGQSLVAPSYSAQAGSAGTLGTLQLPNAFTSAPQSQPSAYVRATLSNPLGQIVQYTDPDSGVTRSLYNGKGQLRFVQPALDPGEQFFLYTRYDALGRTIEEGVVNAAWDPAKLATELDNPDWPGSGDGAVAGRHYWYDGDGSDANALGRLVRVATFNPAPASDPSLGVCDVLESWVYDVLGRVISARLQVSGPTSLDAVAGYHYNNLNEVVRIDLPEGSPLAALTYQYDDQGHIVAIGTPEDPSAIASYGWNADGQLQSAQRGKLAELWNYDSPGNIALHQASVGGDSVFAQTFAYTPDGNIQQRQTAFGLDIASGTREAGYTYDGQQRLASASVANSQPGNLTIDQYDANGNIWAATADGVTLSATCSAGTDQLDSAQFGDDTAQAFRYRADGRPDQWRGLDIGYDPALSTTATISGAGDTIRYARGLNNLRVLRQQGTHRRVAFAGAGSTPLMVWNDGTPQLCIWGPDGLAAVHDGTLSYPVSDHQHTVWAVLDGDGTARCAFDYAAFGTLLSRSGPASADWLFLYAGKEYDSGTGLYDFSARLYDPALLRFLGPDPARQFSSPYVFASNNPLNFMDPSGNISVWAQVGIGIAMAALAVAGIALSIVTAGAAAPGVAAGEAALAGAAVAGEGAAAGVAAAGAAAATEVAGAAAVEGAAGGVVAAAGEVGAGAGAAAVEAAVPMTTAQVIAQNATSVFWSSVSSAITGAGTSGLSYDIQHGRDFTAKGFFQAMGMGALTGFISGGIGGLASMPASVGLTQGMSIGGGILFRTVTQSVAGMVGSDVSALISDAITGKKITASDLLMDSLQGFAIGAASGAFSSVKNINPSKAAVNGAERLAIRTQSFINNSIDNLKSAATSQTAIGLYVPGGFLLVGGYAAWGATTKRDEGSL